MTTAQAVDISGVISSVLASYRTLLPGYQQLVTGDPGALRSTAGTMRSCGQQLTAVAAEVDRDSDALTAGWHGDASHAYQAAATRAAHDLRAVASVLARRADRLTAQAAALQAARGKVDRVIAWFEASANRLIALSAHASFAAVNDFVRVAYALGERAVGLCKDVLGWLAGQLLGPLTDGLTLVDGSLRLEGNGLVFADGGLAQGKDWLQLGPKGSVLGKLDRGAQGWKLIADGKLNLVDAGLSGRYSEGLDSVGGELKLVAGADGKLTISRSAISASGRAGGDLKGMFSITDRLGDATIEHKIEGDVFYGARGSISTESGVEAEGKIGAIAEVSAGESVEAYGIKLGVTGGVTTGEGGELRGGVTFTNGHLKLDVGAGVTEGVGVKGGVNLDVDVPRIGSEISGTATSLWHTATAAGRAIGDAYGRAVQEMAEHPYGYPGF